MTPYATFLYFGLLLYLALPTLGMRLLGLRVARGWLLAAMALLALAQYPGFLQVSLGHMVREMWLVLGYGIYQFLLIQVFLAVRVRVAPPAMARAAAPVGSLSRTASIDGGKGGAVATAPPPRAAAGGAPRASRWIFYATVLLSLLPLLIAKFLPLAWRDHEFGFIGISYVTFRSLDVVFSVQDGVLKSVPALELMVFTLFMPTISSGPVDRFRRFDADWKSKLGRPGLLSDLDSAVHRIFTGFLYKFIIAYLISEHWMNPALAHKGVLAGISYMYAYTFYLFFDFAGYSEFAIGVSHLFGIHPPENFNYPFLARDIRDFWNRWHMSLSYWFRDHVYMRFVLAASKGKWFANKYAASYLGYFLSFGLMGLWHGTQGYFLLYGLYHGILLSGFDWFSRANKQRKWWGTGPLWNAAAVLVTFHFVAFGLLLFSGRIGPGGAAAAESAATANPGQVPPVYDLAIDQCDCDLIAGWAWVETQPMTPIDLDIYVDGKLLTTVTAGEFRHDLLVAGKGTGRHAFTLPTPPQFKDGSLHLVELRVAGQNITSRRGKANLQCDGAALPADGNLQGGIDEATPVRIAGWLFDPEDPDKRLQLTLSEGESKIADLTADQLRPDLLKRGKGDGRHAFAFPTPPQLKDGKPHQITITVQGTKQPRRTTVEYPLSQKR